MYRNPRVFSKLGYVCTTTSSPLSVWLLLRYDYDYISCSSIVAGRALRECLSEYPYEDDQC
jgi:hypothetical protein